MTRSDAFVILIMTLLVAFLYNQYWAFKNETSNATFAQISITGSAAKQISLQTDKIHKVTGRIGLATIQVKNHKVRFIHSPCTKKYCVHSGWLTSVGATAVCMPNGMMISIKNGKNVFDSINF